MRVFRYEYEYLDISLKPHLRKSTGSCFSWAKNKTLIKATYFLGNLNVEEKEHLISNNIMIKRFIREMKFKEIKFTHDKINNSYVFTRTKKSIKECILKKQYDYKMYSCIIISRFLLSRIHSLTTLYFYMKDLLFRYKRRTTVFESYLDAFDNNETPNKIDYGYYSFLTENKNSRKFNSTIYNILKRLNLDYILFSQNSSNSLNNINNIIPIRLMDPCKININTSLQRLNFDKNSIDHVICYSTFYVNHNTIDNIKNILLKDIKNQLNSDGTIIESSSFSDHKLNLLAFHFEITPALLIQAALNTN